MNDPQLVIDDSIDVGLMTDRDLYALHLAALGYPRKLHGGKALATYGASTLKRVLTVCDSVICMVSAMYVGPMAGAACLTAMCFCIFNVAAGPLSLACRLANWYLDLVPAPMPSVDALRIGSVESASAIASYLAEPAAYGAERYVARSQGRLVPVERTLHEVEEIRAGLQEEFRPGSPLGPIFEQELDNAQEIMEALQSRCDEIVTRIQIVQKGQASIQTLIDELRFLARVSSPSVRSETRFGNVLERKTKSAGKISLPPSAVKPRRPEAVLRSSVITPPPVRTRPPK